MSLPAGVMCYSCKGRRNLSNEAGATPIRRHAMDQRILRAARFSVASAASLAAAKLLVGIVSGSLAVLSSAFDSLADIVMSAVNFLFLRKSMDPADANHPYGHGKVETLATILQGMVVAAIGGWVVYEGIRRLAEGRVPSFPDLGIAVMAVGAGASWFIAGRIRRAGERAGSPGLVADSLHYRTDVYTNGGIVLSLVLFRFTGWKWIDPALALLLGGYIVYEAGALLYNALHDLLDRGLPLEVVARVEAIINAHRPMVVDFHDLRTRRAGAQKHVDFHVVVCREFQLKDAHRVADHLEMEVREALGNVCVVTHIDPCSVECPGKEECARILGEIRKLRIAEEQEVGDPGGAERR